MELVNNDSRFLLITISYRNITSISNTLKLGYSPERDLFHFDYCGKKIVDCNPIPMNAILFRIIFDYDPKVDS